MPHIRMGGSILSSDINEIQGELVSIQSELANRLDNIELNASRIILSMDIQYCEQIMSKMDTKNIEVFVEHLHKLKLLSEKVLLDRS